MELKCKQCGEPLVAGKCTVTAEGYFCSVDHHIIWNLGERLIEALNELGGIEDNA